jgi:hypothetical protein
VEAMASCDFLLQRREITHLAFGFSRGITYWSLDILQAIGTDTQRSLALLQG